MWLKKRVNRKLQHQPPGDRTPHIHRRGKQHKVKRRAGLELDAAVETVSCANSPETKLQQIQKSTTNCPQHTQTQGLLFTGRVSMECYTALTQTHSTHPAPNSSSPKTTRLSLMIKHKLSGCFTRHKLLWICSQWAPVPHTSSWNTHH